MTDMTDAFDAFPENPIDIQFPEYYPFGCYMIELMPAGVNIPLCGSIPAGFASDREQQPEGCDSVDVATIGFKATRNTFALRVVGDSMIGKHICADDSRVQTVLISLQRPIAEAKQELRKESSPEPQSS